MRMRRAKKVKEARQVKEVVGVSNSALLKVVFPSKEGRTAATRSCSCPLRRKPGGSLRASLPRPARSSQDTEMAFSSFRRASRSASSARLGCGVPSVSVMARQGCVHAPTRQAVGRLALTYSSEYPHTRLHLHPFPFAGSARASALVAWIRRRKNEGFRYQHR